MIHKSNKPVIYCGFTVGLLCSAIWPGVAVSAPEYTYHSDEDTSVPFVIVVEENTFQSMLAKVSRTTIALKKKKILEKLTEDLEDEDRFKIEEGKAEAVAKQVYAKVIKPKIQKRVEAFNDAMNKILREDKVSAGLLAFNGLAAAMASMSKNRVSTAEIDARYVYKGDNFQNGSWKWPHEGLTSGSGSMSRGYHLAIDKTLRINLAPFGVHEVDGDNPTTEIWFHCNGKVKLSGKYGWRFIGTANSPSDPQTTRRFRPYLDVTATKDVPANRFFEVSGKEQEPIEKRIEHPATMQLQFTAEKQEPVE